MTPLVATVNQILGFLTIIGIGLSVVLIINKVFTIKIVEDLLKKYSLLFAFIIATIATVGSLFYSEIAGFTPCKLCWLQRICMYPLSLILGLAYFKKDLNIRTYVKPFTVIGGLIALYHYYTQMGGTLLGGCTAGGIDCSKRYSAEYGFITIPFMAFIAFVLIFLFLSRKNK